MWQYDFHLFYQAGQAVLAGLSPYTIFDFNPPYPLAVLFALIAWLPESVAYWVYTGACLGLMWKVLGKRSLWVVLSFPVWFSLFVGQVDLPLGLLVSWVGFWGLPLTLIKPQVGLALAPWYLWRMTWKQRGQVLALTSLFLAICFALRPVWLSEWLAITPSLTQYARRDSNFYWLVPTDWKTMAIVIGGGIALITSYWLKERSRSWVILHLFAPLTNIYSASILAEWIGPIEAALSWAAILVVGQIHAGAPMFVVGVSILLRPAIKQFLERRALISQR